MAFTIQNERQYELTKTQLTKMEAAYKAARIELSEQQDLPEIIRQGQLNGIQMLIGDLQNQLAQYEELRSGQVHALELASVLDELPSALTRARIARGWTQKELAQALGTSAQQVQKDEAGGYSKANLSKLTHVANVLEVQITGRARLRRRASRRPKAASTK